MAELYDYESMGAEAFQQLCQALLAASYPEVQCFPVGMPDGGRDASVPQERVADAAIYQVKFRRPTPNKLTTPDDVVEWVTKALSGELAKIRKLAERGADRYVLMTNAQCSSHLDSGTRDRVQEWLDAEMPIPAQVWWRDDLDRRLDGNTDIKRTYGLLRDVSGLAELLGLRDPDMTEHAFIKLAKRDPQVSVLMKYMAHQYKRDRVVKFKQAELEPQLLDVFIDVPLGLGPDEKPVYSSNHLAVALGGDRLTSPALQMWSGLVSDDVSHAFMTSNRTSGRPTASVLLSRAMVRDGAPARERVVIEGAPGQGKSTVGQYVCQVHRARLLDSPEVARFASHHLNSPIRLPFHVDFRDLAAWLRRQDPFDISNSGQPVGWGHSLESFLTAQIKRASGGMDFSVSDLDAVLRATPALLVLDGLDEVPDLNDRRAVVTCVNEALNRIEPFSPSFRTVATSRPSSFAKTPGFSKREYTYFTLGDLPLQLVLEYTDGWLTSRSVNHQAAHEIRQVLGQKLGQPHIVDLARNPMQLAILLWLVRKKGPSLPDKRTALYREYMETFLDREAEKSEIIRDERELILDLHGYVAWVLHCQAETGDSNGSISIHGLKSLLKKYLVLRGYKKKKLDLVDQLFTGMTDRVMVLTSRVLNTFEFEVQPLREYFAARYLYTTARTSSPGAEKSGNRSDRFEALLRNPYWWNVTRFYAGFSDVGELANLVDLLEELVTASGDFSLISYSREVALTLLRDQVFSQKPRSVAKVVDLISTEESVALLSGRGSSMVSLPADAGGEDIVERLMARVEKSVSTGSIPDFDAAKIMGTNVDAHEVVDWWFRKWSTARGVRNKRAWFAIGRHADLLHALTPSQCSEIAEVLGADLNFWETIVQLDMGTQPFSGEFDRYFEAVRHGVMLHSGRHLYGYSSIQGIQTSIVSRLTVDHLRYLVQSDGGVDPWTVHRPVLPEGLLRREEYRQLGSKVDTAFSLIARSPNPRNRYDIWVAFHEAITEALGGQCPRTLALATELGEVRGGRISRSRVEHLLDPSSSPVLRARFARQKRADVSWWADQFNGIVGVDDAFFLMCCVMRWAPPSVIVDNSRRIEKWVRMFDAYTLQNIRFMATPTAEVIPAGVDFRVPGLAYLASIRMPRKERLKMLANLSDICKSRELEAIVTTERLRMLTSPPFKDWVNLADEVVDVYQRSRADERFLSLEVYTAPLPAQASRSILQRVVDFPLGFKISANESLTAEVGQKAVTLADASARGEWFDRETLD
ncbi:NACHT domain-containing protein [Streptomyces sp. NPDC059134]|uniref:NACHT domain-containing protein n=1 Tax=Streptomyces sp. NPDC059134 TaxID=3346738 RepID=UPI00368F4782